MASNRLHGVGGAPGIAIGPAFQFRGAGAPVPPIVNPDRALHVLAAAQQSAAAYFEMLAQRQRDEGFGDEAGIFEFQALLAEDPDLSAGLQERIASGTSLGAALREAIEELSTQFRASANPVIQARTSDLVAVEQAILRALSGQDIPEVPTGVVLFAHDLSPADTVELQKHVAGIVLAGGGPSSHCAILARARGIPLVLGAGPAVLGVTPGVTTIVDGSAHDVLVAPSANECALYRKQQDAAGRRAARRGERLTQPGVLASGERIVFEANISSVADARAAATNGAEGIGLVRTEVLYYGDDGRRTSPPDEAEQLAFYRAVLAELPGVPVTVRTADIGGDKPVTYLGLDVEANPFLGVRGIRLSMRYPALLRTQLRALVQAAQHGDLRIMVPMVATPEDMQWSRAALRDAQASLDADGIAFRADVPFGAMIETPAAALSVDLLAPYADFFSIGTNDLAQYTLAADRGVSSLAERYPHTATGVLRLVELAVQAADARTIPLAVCGDLAGEPDAASILVGLGVTRLSMAPPLIPVVKEHLAARTLAQLRARARSALRA